MTHQQQNHTQDNKSVSILIPFFNEEESLPHLIEAIRQQQPAGYTFELVFVDDGSTDNSAEAIRVITGGSTTSPSEDTASTAHSTGKVIPDDSFSIKLLTHRRQMGKGKALLTAYTASTGNIIIFMDADLEDDPEMLPRFISKIEEGYELINGYRKGRKHSAVIKLYSGLANSLVRSLLNSPFHDINCGYKAMRREVLDSISLYGNNFRFFPLAAYYEGFKVTEIVVSHKNRLYGTSKFGPGKLFIGILDTFTAYFLYRFAERPLHFFGIAGGMLLLAGFCILGVLGFERIVLGEEIYRRPILFLGMLCTIVGVQVIATGFIGELIVYYQKMRRPFESATARSEKP